LARLNWDKLSKLPRDPGFADERPADSRLVVPPKPSAQRRLGLPHRLSSGERRRAQQAAGSGEAKWVDLLERVTDQKLRLRGDAKSNKKQAKRKKSGKTGATAEKSRKSGATTAFDRFSLGLDKAPKSAAKAASKSAPKRGAMRGKAKSVSVKKKGQRERRAEARRAKVAAIRGGTTAASAKSAAALNPASKQTPKVRSLKVEIRSSRPTAVTLEWEPDSQVRRWKAICLDDEGRETRKATVAAPAHSVTIGGLGEAETYGFLVCGHDQFGQVVREGFVERAQPI
jgi:hypothetical protein